MINPELIDRGTAPNNNTGDTARVGAQKINNNFTKVYNSLFAFDQILINTTLNDTHRTIEATASLTITLPTAVNISGKEYKIANSSTDIVRINDINGTLIAELTTQGESISLISNGTTWLIF